MKKLVMYFSAALAIMAIAGCDLIPNPVAISVQLVSGRHAIAVEQIMVKLEDEASTTTFEIPTDASGKATFLIIPGTYTASATYKTVEDGESVTYNGSAPIIVAEEGQTEFELDLSRVATQQLVIKELYSGGCPKNEGTGSFSNDAYFIIYNNSAFEADATDLVFGNVNPYNGQSNNKYYDAEGKLIYEHQGWIPAGGAVWYFTQPVKIPAYSQIVVAVFGAIDHTATVTASVNLANADYYWMSNGDIPAFTNAKYAVSDVIPTSHYLSGYQINKSNAWVLSNTAPAFWMGKISKSVLQQLVADTEKYDQTAGTGDVNWAVKVPSFYVIGCLEVFKSDKLESSYLRFPSYLNTGYAVLANQMGYTIYRNVDKEATEALPENAGKLVYNYAGGTEDVNGTTDPSGIDAEASIKAGAHIVYLQTNDSSKDFHQRKVSSLK